METVLTWKKTTTKRRKVRYLEFWSFMVKAGAYQTEHPSDVLLVKDEITEPWSHELAKSHFVLPVTLSGAKQENVPSLLHSEERIIVGNDIMAWNLAPTSFPRYLFCPRPQERGCHCLREYFSALLEVTNCLVFSLVLCVVSTYC